MFGMIRIGSQVDLIVPDLPGLEIKVASSDSPADSSDRNIENRNMGS